MNRCFGMRKTYRIITQIAPDDAVKPMPVRIRVMPGTSVGAGDGSGVGAEVGSRIVNTPLFCRSISIGPPKIASVF
jgi:hypothetical protein